jgi:hypothetical protein
VNEKRRARLWDAAPAREREVLEEEIAGAKGAEYGDQDPSPAGCAGGIEERGQASRQKYECDDHEPDERADDQAEQKCEAILLAAEVFDPPAQSRR